MVYLLLYVDDIIITRNNPPFIDHLISRLSVAFDLKDLGPLTFFLGLLIEYTSQGLFVHQSKYTLDLLTKSTCWVASLVSLLVHLLYMLTLRPFLSFLILLPTGVWLVHCSIWLSPGLICPILFCKHVSSWVSLLNTIWWQLFGDLFQLPNHVWSVGGMTLLGPGSFWGVASGTQYWVTWSNGYWHTFKPTKSLKPDSKNHDNG